MCLDRRAFLVGGAATAAGVAVGTRAAAPADARPAPQPAVGVAPGLAVLPRDAWGADLPAPADLPAEAPGDVRVLLVHHSASTNDYGPEQVAGQIRAFHALHTGPERGWPDVAYNFFVDRYGQVWEGRAGSLDRPVIGDATGGNQGHSQLVCLVGDFVTTEPTPGAMGSLALVLAWLARRSGVDVRPGATTSFVSRGSNRWPEGTTVETTTIAGHRDMSSTTCPGDVAYAHVRGDLPVMVADRVVVMAAADPPPATPVTTAAAAAASSPTTVGGTATEAATETASAGRAGGDNGDGPPALAVGGAAAVVAGAAVVVGLRRRDRRPPEA